MHPPTDDQFKVRGSLKGCMISTIFLEHHPCTSGPISGTRILVLTSRGKNKISMLRVFGEEGEVTIVQVRHNNQATSHNNNMIITKTNAKGKNNDNDKTAKRIDMHNKYWCLLVVIQS